MTDQLPHEAVSSASVISIVTRGWGLVTPNSEILLFTICGVIGTIAEVMGYWPSLSVTQLFTEEDDAMSDLTNIIYTISESVAVARFYSVHIYLATYILLPYPVIKEKKQVMLTPWLLCGVLRSLALSLVTALAGITLCAAHPRLHYPCLQYAAASGAEFCISLFAWTSVHSFYHYLDKRKLDSDLGRVLKTIHKASERTKDSPHSSARLSLNSIDDDSLLGTEEKLVERAAMAWIGREILEHAEEHVSDVQFSQYLSLKASMELRKIISDLAKKKKSQRKRRLITEERLFHGQSSPPMDILQRVQQIDEQFEDGDVTTVADSDDESEDEECELAARLAGVDLDDADSVWQRLTVQERQQFQELLRSGEVTSVVPHWQPWWHYRSKKNLVEDIDISSRSDIDECEFVSTCPTIKADIQSLSALSKVSPSLWVRWNVVNVLAAYAMTTRIYNGDHQSEVADASATLVRLSGNLAVNQPFDSPEVAVAAVQLVAVNIGCIECGVDENQLKDDVKRLVEGPSETQHNQYVLAALSDIHKLFTSAKQNAKESSRGAAVQGEFSKKFPISSSSSAPHLSTSKLHKYIKKIEFYRHSGD